MNDDLATRTRQRMEREGIPVGTDNPILLALGAQPLPPTPGRGTIEQEQFAIDHGYPSWEAYGYAIYGGSAKPLTELPDESTLRVDIPPPPMQ